VCRSHAFSELNIDEESIRKSRKRREWRRNFSTTMDHSPVRLNRPSGELDSDLTCYSDSEDLCQDGAAEHYLSSKMERNHSMFKKLIDFTIVNSFTQNAPEQALGESDEVVSARATKKFRANLRKKT